MRTSLFLCSVVLVAAPGLFGIVACGKKQPPKEPMITETVADAGPEPAPPEPPAPKSLYERLGNKEGIAQVVDSFVTNMAKDPATKKRFAKLSKDRIEKFKKNLTEQLCKETGGDCVYEKQMKDVHKGMRITEAEWNATVIALKAALDEHTIGNEEQNDVVAAIARMKDDIVEKPKGKK